MLVDLHTHSTASDGALSPVDLVRRACEAGVEVLAITDHDCVGGYLEARDYCAAGGAGLCLVPGVEFSCQWSGVGVHIVGLGMAVEHAAMQAGLGRLRAARDARAEIIARRLASRGFEGALDGARRCAGGSQLGRPHFADWMVEQGHVRDSQEAFERYLGQGRIGDVKAVWPTLDEVVGWITAAGGVAVIAHPLKYRLTRMKLRRLATDFKDCGGSAVEVLAGRQPPDQFPGLLRLAADFAFEASIGSDFHRDHSWGVALGVEPPRLGSVRGLWERWLDLDRAVSE